MGDVVVLPIPTTADHKPDDILEQAKGRGFSVVLVLAWQPDGKLWMSSSTSDAERLSFMVEMARYKLAQMVDV